MLGILGSLLSGPLGNAIGKAAEGFFDNAEKKAAFENAVQLELLKNQKEIDGAANEIMLAQIEVNKAEAESGSLFKGGWRPATGWICVAALGFNFLVVPALTAFGLAVPMADMATMMPILLGMLGLAGLRTTEKVLK